MSPTARSLRGGAPLAKGSVQHYAVEFGRGPLLTLIAAAALSARTELAEDVRLRDQRRQSG